MEYKIIIQCCVCKIIVGDKPTDRADQHLEVSHTYCESCMKEVMQQIESM